MGRVQQVANEVQKMKDRQIRDRNERNKEERKKKWKVNKLFQTIACHPYKVKLSRYRHVGDKKERIYSSYSFLNLALDGDERSASRPSRSVSRVKDLWYPVDRKLCGTRAKGIELRSSSL
jgi:hypothetical protein